MANITFEEHYRLVQKSWKIYDNIDFVPYFKECGTLSELRERLEADYDNTQLTNNEVMKGCIFNVMSDARLLQYLNKRYGDKFTAGEFTDYWINFKD